MIMSSLTYGQSSFFFFSSRRRHTRCSRDWSSDVCSSDLKPVRPSELRFPLIVKPLLEDASVGIAQASVVKDDEELGVRVKFIHEKFHQAAIVEELIEGRELYVGLIGNEIGRASCRERV